MKSDKNPANTKGPTRFLALLTSPTGDAVFRFGVGLGILPVLQRTVPTVVHGWLLLLSLVAVLLSLRIVPAVVRKVFPFPGECHEIWFARRQVAKRFDSYQWQKLFWVGLGLSTYITISRSWDFSAATQLAAGCLLTGAVGLLRWRSVGASLRERGTV